MPGDQLPPRAPARPPSPAAEFALYQLDGLGSAIGPDSSQPFDVILYSKYKYGSAAAAGVFARALGTAFLARNHALVTQHQLLVAASPYRHVPTAAHALAVRFTAMLTTERARHRLPPAYLVRIDRAVVPPGDYGTLPADARARLMAGNALSFDRLRPGPDGAHLIVVDDVKVTGAHQRCLLLASDVLPLGSRMFVHVAAVQEAGAGLDPTLEDRLNHAFVKSLGELADVATAADFSWNVRVCKFLLSPASRPGLPSFLAGMPDHFVRELHRNSLLDGYAGMAAYRPSHTIVRRELSRRGGPSVDRPTMVDVAELSPQGPRT